MTEQDRGRLIAGAVLIVIGLGLLALQFVEGLGESVMLFLIGGAFIAGYFYRRSYGLLIPGCILMGIGLGSVGESALIDIGGLSSVGLGVGFVAIYLIDLVYSGATHWWPLIPGGILIVQGLSEGSRTFERLFEVGWPLIIIFVGLLILAGAFGLTGQKKA